MKVTDTLKSVGQTLDGRTVWAGQLANKRQLMLEGYVLDHYLCNDGGVRVGWAKEKKITP